ncbi:MAG TPA: Lpp/OprI family alanine-zipper lipoprotein [Gammaproteobacteria bacterium]|nr:Lpp/OprI family alanine-zipper lipoprotein [Gammaproteobacteria bacterium]
MAMRNKGSKLLALAAMVAVLGLSGCASTSELEKVRAMAQQAQNTAQQAQQSADQAMNTAKQAQSTADAAAKSADKANQCCKHTNEKIDRMFKKSMYK